jgi:hypothetical protein
VTTPQDPGQPPYNPYEQPGSYRAGQQPGQYSSAPLPGQQPYPAQPYPAPGQPPYGYSPYGSPVPPLPAGPGDDAPVRRPGAMALGLVLMVVAAVPFLFLGVSALLTPLAASDIPPETLNDPRLTAAGITPELLISAARVLAGVFIVVALLYLLLATFAFRGRNWARILVTVLSVGFVLLLAAVLVGGAGVGGLLVVVAVVAVAVVGGVVTLFLPDSNRFFAAPRRL